MHMYLYYCPSLLSLPQKSECMTDSHVSRAICKRLCFSCNSYAWFPALRFRSSVSVSVTVSVKPCPYCRSVTPFRKRRCRSPHISEWPGGPSGLAGEFPALPSGRSSRQRRNGNGENRTRSYMNECTATATYGNGKRYFLRKL